MVRLEKYSEYGLLDEAWFDKLVEDYARRLQAPTIYSIFEQDGIIYGDHCLGTGDDYNGTVPEDVINDVLTNGLTAGRTSQEKVIIKGAIPLTNEVNVPSLTAIQVLGQLSVDPSFEVALGGIFKIADTVSDVTLVGGRIVGCGLRIGAFYVEGTRIKVYDMEITGFIHSAGNAGYFGTSSVDGVLMNLYSHGNKRGLQADHVTGLTIAKSLFDANTALDIYSHGVSGSDNVPKQVDLIGNKFMNGASGVVLYGQDHLVAYNRFRDKGSYGLKCTETIDSIITHNLFHNCDKTTPNSQAALTLWGIRTKVTENIFRSNPISTYHKYCIDEDEVSEDNEIIGNTVKNAYVTAPFNILGDRTILRNNLGYNPVGLVSTPFETATTKIGLSGDEAAPTASTNYVVYGIDIYVTSTGGTGVSITITDQADNTILSGLTTLTHLFLPIGWKINFGAFSVAPTVTVAGN